jgi:5-formyltetrahydrofolate cyclo-ligase
MKTASAVHPAKAALRAAALARRDRLGASHRAAASERIAGRVMEIVAAAMPQVLAAYLPIRS